MKTFRLLAVIEAGTITGPAKNLLKFAEGLRHLPQPTSMEVCIVTYQRAGSPTLFAETVQRAGIPFRAIPERGRFDTRVLGQLKAVVAEWKPDLIQSHAVKSHFLVRLSGLYRKIPWVAFHHGYTWPDARMRIYNQLDRWSLRATRKVITVNRVFKEDLTRRGISPNHIEVVHNSIDSGWGSVRAASEPGALRTTLGIPPEHKIVLSVGRLSHEKDHMTLLRAFQRLLERDVHLVIVGDGPQRERLESAVRAMDLARRVTFVGQVSSAQPYYGIADAYVLHSLSEGSPNALLEAMAAGVPVVATSVGGIPEIVTHEESALLVQPRDDAGMANAISRLLADSELSQRLAHRSEELIRTRHTPEAHTRRLCEIYRSVCAQSIR